MDQKLQNLFLSLPSRTAWIIIGSCAAYWLLCLTGVLTPPLSVPPDIALFWFYAMLMLALASGLAAVAFGGLLLMRRQRGAPLIVGAPRDPGQAGVQPGDPRPADDEDRDQLAGLGRMLDGPEDSAAAPAGASAPPAARVRSPKRKKQRRRRR